MQLYSLITKLGPVHPDAPLYGSTFTHIGDITSGPNSGWYIYSMCANSMPADDSNGASWALGNVTSVLSATGNTATINGIEPNCNNNPSTPTPCSPANTKWGIGNDTSGYPAGMLNWWIIQDVQLWNWYQTATFPTTIILDVTSFGGGVYSGTLPTQLELNFNGIYDLAIADGTTIQFDPNIVLTPASKAILDQLWLDFGGGQQSTSMLVAQLLGAFCGPINPGGGTTKDGICSMPNCTHTIPTPVNPSCPPPPACPNTYVGVLGNVDVTVDTSTPLNVNVVNTVTVDFTPIIAILQSIADNTLAIDVDTTHIDNDLHDLITLVTNGNLTLTQIVNSLNNNILPALQAIDANTDQIEVQITALTALTQTEFDQTQTILNSVVSGLADILTKLNETCAGNPINVNVCNQVDLSIIEGILGNILTEVVAINANTNGIEGLLNSIILELQTGNANTGQLVVDIQTVISLLQAIDVNTDGLEALLTTVISTLITESDQTQVILGNILLELQKQEVDLVISSPAPICVDNAGVKTSYYVRELTLFNNITATNVSVTTQYSSNGTTWTNTAPTGTITVGFCTVAPVNLKEVCDVRNASIVGNINPTVATDTISLNIPAGLTVTGDSVLYYYTDFGTGYADVGTLPSYDYTANNVASGHYELKVYAITASGNKLLLQAIEYDWNGTTITMIGTPAPVNRPYQIKVGTALQSYTGTTPTGSPVNPNGTTYTPLGTLQFTCPPIIDDLEFINDVNGGNIAKTEKALWRMSDTVYPVCTSWTISYCLDLDYSQKIEWTFNGSTQTFVAVDGSDLAAQMTGVDPNGLIWTYNSATNQITTVTTIDPTTLDYSFLDNQGVTPVNDAVASCDDSNNTSPVCSQNCVTKTCFLRFVEIDYTTATPTITVLQDLELDGTTPYTPLGDVIRDDSCGNTLDVENCKDNRRDELLARILSQLITNGSGGGGTASSVTVSNFPTNQNVTITAPSTAHTLTSGTGAIPAGLRTVTIKWVSGVVSIGSFTLDSTNTSLSLDATEFTGTLTKTLPAITPTGGTWQWIGLS